MFADIEATNASGRRAVVMITDERMPAPSPLWQERLGSSPILVCTGESPDDVLESIDRLDLAPCVLGFGEGALAALLINAEGAALCAAAVGGRHDGDLSDPDSMFSGPLLLIGADADPDLPEAQLRARAAAHQSEHRVEVRLLSGTLRSMVAGEGADAASALVSNFFARNRP